jgi:hypothetical protein
MSFIESSAFQEFGQGYSADKTEKRPGQRNIKVKVLARNQPKQATESDYNYAENVNCNRPVGCTGASTYAIQAQKAAY